MVFDREPQPPGGWAFQADQGGLITRPDLRVHVAVDRVGLGAAGVGHRQTVQVAIQPKTLTLPTPPSQLPFEERPAEFFQNLDNLVGLVPIQGLQGSADARVIGLTFLAPGFGHGLVFVQGMGLPG